MLKVDRQILYISDSRPMRGQRQFLRRRPRLLVEVSREAANYFFDRETELHTPLMPKRLT
jgi:hypothetical protein